MRTFELSELNYVFQVKPLLIGGMAMEYYGLRKAGADVDFVVVAADYEALAQQYPEGKTEIFGDLGIRTGQYELWKSICLFEYEALAVGAIEMDQYRIISLEKLLFLKTLGYKEPKYQADLQLVVDKILNIKYGKDSLPT